jgi:hypothetical protein
MAGDAQAVLLAADQGFATLQARTLVSVEPSGANALRDALLLVIAALVDGCSVAGQRRGRGLRKANGGTKCKKSDAKQRNFHGSSPWEAAV